MNIEDIKVMVCDDSMLVRKSMCMFIKSLGVKTIVEAANGQEAVNNYILHNPDIVFMDIVMPDMTGIEALTKIKESDPNAKIIMASSTGTQNYLKSAIKAGAVDFLQKPITNDQLKQILENVSKGVI